MIRKLIHYNLVFFAVLLALLVVFGISLYWGSEQVYNQEEQWRGQKTMAEVNSGKISIDSYFYDFARDLEFTISLPELKDYISDNFTPTKRVKAEQILSNLIKGKNFYQITMVNTNDQEMLQVKSSEERTLSWTNGLSNTDIHRNLFQTSLKLMNGQASLSNIYFATEIKGSFSSKRVIMTIAMPLIDQNVKGIVFVDFDLSNVFKVLPNSQLFIQINDGTDIFFNPQNGNLDIKNLNYPLSANSNWYSLNTMERIHYSKVDIFGQQPFILAQYHYLPLLKITLGKLIYVFLALLLLFLILVIYSMIMNFTIVKKLFNTQRAIVFSLASLAEGRDPETGTHLERSRDYAVILSEQLRTHKQYKKLITSEFIYNLHYAAALHDIGKVAVPDTILLKQGELTESEFEEIKKHVLTGKNILKDTIEKYHLKESFLEMGMNICAYHHEKFNGKGYPEGLKAQEIPLEARIFALCDAYDAIRSKRSYKEPVSHKEAVKRIVADANQHFDPEVVEAFLECEERFLGIYK